MENDIIDQPEKRKEPWMVFKNTIYSFILLFVIGKIFKILHWPGGGIFILASVAFITAFTLVMLIFGRKTTVLPKYFYTVCALIIISYIFDLIHYPLESFLIFLEYFTAALLVALVLKWRLK